MGTSVSVVSTDFLLQREDIPAAFEALRSFARECPADLRSEDGHLVGATLVEALQNAHWRATTDEHGDITSLVHTGDKVPPDATDDYPMALFEVLAPFVRYGHFVRSMDGAALTFHTLGRGTNTYRERSPGVWLRQCGAPPALAEGVETVIELEVVVPGRDDATVSVEVTHSTQIDHRFEAVTLSLGERARLFVTPRSGAADPIALFVTGVVDDVDSFDYPVRVVAPAREPRALPARVIATASSVDSGDGSVVVRARDLDEALRAMKRYAIRHEDPPGAAFLHGVLDAPDLAAAFRCAGIACSMSDAGVHGFRLVAPELPGEERYVFGLWASLRGIVEGDPWFELTYEHDPDTNVLFSYEWGVPGRSSFPR